MNGYSSHRHDDGDDPFGPANGNGSGMGSMRMFDAFPKVKATYTEAHANGQKFTIFLLVLSAFLTLVELGAYWRPHETSLFSVEKGVGHEMEFNLDIVVLMHCEDLRIHVSDSSGDRIFAAEKLSMEPTNWKVWAARKGMTKFEDTEATRRKHNLKEYSDDDQFHVREVVDAQGRWFKKNYPKTPRLWGGEADSCRIFGTLFVNKVQANAHITARGHMYMEWPPNPKGHLDHKMINFTHIVNELSFGPYYPTLNNPLDSTINQTPDHFFKYQYFMSIVPTLILPANGAEIRTNQFAVTSQSHIVGESMAPGIFFKYDIEPIQLIIKAESHSFLRLVMRVVNILSGVLVSGQWLLSFTDVIEDVYGDRIRKTLGLKRTSSSALLGEEKRSV